MKIRFSSVTWYLTLTLPDLTKSDKNYLQNTQHVVLRNRPTLTIGTERLAGLNSPMACSWGPSPSTLQVPGSSPGSGGRATRAFFLHPTFLTPSGDSFFRNFPTNPPKVLGLICTLLAWCILTLTLPDLTKPNPNYLSKLAEPGVLQSTYPRL